MVIVLGVQKRTLTTDLPFIAYEHLASFRLYTIQTVVTTLCLDGVV